MDPEPQISLVRPFDFSSADYHLNIWKERDITVLICQRNTNDLIRLCLESLLRFYPDINVLVVDGTSTDDSAFYLKYKSILHPNVKVWTRSGINSHGMTMDDAIHKHITTKYMLLMDSDVIIERGGCIEGMLHQFYVTTKLYATGSLMLVTRANYACGPPLNDADILPYAHPSFSIYDVEKYKELKAPFVDHGAPCVYNIMAALENKLQIGYYPVDKYVSHLCGGSWTLPRTIWPDDHNVSIRPFVTFIINLDPGHIPKLKAQTDHDFDVVLPMLHECDPKSIVMYGSESKMVKNKFYDIRHNVCGEYVCVLPDGLEIIQPEFMKTIKVEAINQSMPQELNVGGLQLLRRNLWQKRESLI